MSDPFYAEIRIFPFGFAPKSWAKCDGQTLQINQNQALFSLMGTSYGGNGTTNFQLPNLQGRAAVGLAATTEQGEAGGVATVTLTAAEMPAHTHGGVPASTAAGTTRDPAGAVPAKESAGETNLYGEPNGAAMGAAFQSGIAGGGEAHPNVMPSLALNFCIALTGVFPSRE